MIYNILNRDEQTAGIKIIDKIVVLVLLVIIFMLLLCYGGVKTYPDTESYLKMSSIREPGYGLILNGLKVLFGNNGFVILGVFQNILAVYSVYFTAVYFGKSYNSKYIFYIAAVILILPYVVTPLFASSRIILTNAMISEGVTLSLYYFYFRYLLMLLWEDNNKNKYCLRSLLIALLLSLFRGQMLITFIAWFIVVSAIWLKDKNRRKVLETVLLLVLTIVIRTFCINGCNYITNGKFTGTTYGSVTILSNVIYVSEREDGAEIENETVRQIFYDIYDLADAGEMLYKYAPDDFSKEAAFYSKMHDEIKDQAIYPYLQSYTENIEKLTYIDQLVRMDELADCMTKELLPQKLGVFAEHYILNVAVGLIRTVAFVHPFFNISALFGYVILAAAGIYCFIKDRESKAVKMLFLTAILTLGNVTAVALTIMCLSRYMIYNMAFVYISGLLLLLQIIGDLYNGKK